MSWYELWLFVHFVGIVVFVGGHGVSAAVTLRLPRERDPERLETLLSLSRGTIVWSNVGLLVLLVGGVANWVRGGYSPQGWLWASAAVLALLAAIGLALAAPYFRRIRSALANRDEERLAEALSTPLPWVIFWVETAGVLVILWLMVAKPF
jgi:uncharacterized membrane protein